MNSKTKFIKEAYLHLKEMYWPIVIIRGAIVLSVIGILAYLAIAMAVGLIFAIIVFAVFIYLVVLLLAIAAGIAVGASSPKKSHLALTRRNRTIQLSGLTIWIVASGYSLPLAGLQSSQLVGLLSIAALLFFLMYLSLLASESMFLDDTVEGEERAELVFRRLLYIPLILLRDLLLPIVAIIICLALSYESSMCSTIQIFESSLDGLNRFTSSVIPTQSWIGEFLYTWLDGASISLNDWMDNIRIQYPELDLWLIARTPSCNQFFWY